MRKAFHGRQDFEQGDVAALREDAEEGFPVLRFCFRRAHQVRTVLAKANIRIRPRQDVVVGFLVLLIHLVSQGGQRGLPVGDGEVRPLQIGRTLGLPLLFGDQVVI